MADAECECVSDGIEVLSSNLLFHCFVRYFIQDNGVCNVLNETEIVATFRKARFRGMAINYFGFWITILANTDCPLQSCFSRNRSFQHYCSSKYHISGNNVNIEGIEVSYFCSVCALFEYVIKHEYVLTDK